LVVTTDEVLLPTIPGPLQVYDTLLAPVTVAVVVWVVLLQVSVPVLADRLTVGAPDEGLTVYTSEDGHPVVG
jgi:hypothetical protein